MTKKEVLKAIRNHSKEIKIAMLALDFQIHSLVHEFRPEAENEIAHLMDMMDFVKGRADEIKVILDGWPD